MKQIKSNKNKNITVKKNGNQEFITGLPSETLPTEIKENMKQQASDSSLQMFGKRIEVDLDSYLLGDAVGARFLFKEWKKEMSIKGKKGGEKNKICQPILKALIQYLDANPRIEGMSNNHIAEEFIKGITDEPMIVNCNQSEWDISYQKSDRLIFAEPDSNNRKVNKITSRSITTIRKTYIPKAKEEIKKQK